MIQLCLLVLVLVLILVLVVEYERRECVIILVLPAESDKGAPRMVEHRNNQGVEPVLTANISAL